MLHCRFMVHSLGVFLNMYMIRVTLDKGTGPRQIKLWFSLHDIILEGKPIGPDLKKIFKESSWFWESKCKLGSKVVDFIFIFTFFFIVVAQILWKWKTCYGLLRAHYLLHFEPILELTWLILWIFKKWLLEGIHFKFLSWIGWDRKWRVEMSIFASARGFGFTIVS